MTDNNKVVIIGGGHNGLVCAAYLAKAGKQVTVLEASSQVGGAAITREFAPGFRVSAGAHLLYLLDKGIRKDLALDSHGLQIAKKSMSTIALGENGQHLTFSGNTVSGEGVSADDKTAMVEYHRFMTRFAGIIGRLHNQTPPRIRIDNRGDLISFESGERFGIGDR